MHHVSPLCVHQQRYGTMLLYRSDILAVSKNCGARKCQAAFNPPCITDDDDKRERQRTTSTSTGGGGCGGRTACHSTTTARVVLVKSSSQPGLGGGSCIISRGTGWRHASMDTRVLTYLRETAYTLV